MTNQTNYCLYFGDVDPCNSLYQWIQRTMNEWNVFISFWVIIQPHTQSILSKPSGILCYEHV